MNKSESKYFNTAVRMDEAFISILEKKPFEYITVSEICEKAGVHRSTFYLHYENTGDLLAETTQHIINGFLACFPTDTSRITDRFSGCSLADLNYISPEYLQPFLSYIRENRRIFSTVMACSGTLNFEQIFQKMFRYIFNPILERFEYPPDDREYVIRFYLNGISAIVEKWIRDDCEKSIEEITAIIHKCIFGLKGKELPMA